MFLFADFLQLFCITTELHHITSTNNTPLTTSTTITTTTTTVAIPTTCYSSSINNNTTQQQHHQHISGQTQGAPPQPNNPQPLLLTINNMVIQIYT
jgi:hypothetical protein